MLSTMYTIIASITVLSHWRYKYEVIVAPTTIPATKSKINVYSIEHTNTVDTSTDTSNLHKH